MMYQIGDTVWSIIHHFDRPKETIIVDKQLRSNSNLIIIIDYIVKYKNREYLVRNENVYPTAIDADIYWSILIKQEYECSLEIPELYLTDDFERANILATKILNYYAQEKPDKLLKYL